MKSSRVSRRGFVLRSAGAIGAAGLVVRGARATERSNEIEAIGMLNDEWVKQSVNELPTPVLLVDLDIFERNLKTMAEACRGREKSFRPHGKAHKSPVVARKQLESGAHGLCAAKLGEAEVLVRGGIRDVLITAAVVGRRKIDRLMSLAALDSNLKVVADNTQNVMDLSAAATAAGRTLTVLVDVNVGQNRTGLDQPEEAAALAALIAKSKGLRFGGVQGYGGHNMHVVGFDKRRAATLGAVERAIAARDAIKRAGIDVPIISVGGTGSYNIDTTVAGVTEIQPGSYIFMDAHYRSIGSEKSEIFSDFGNALTVLTTVISRPSKGRAITDGGNKALTTDEGPAAPRDLTGVAYRPGGDEHGILTLENPSRDLQVGDKLEFVPGHCDTTVNLYDRFFAVRKGVVEAVWPIEGRGRSD